MRTAHLAHRRHCGGNPIPSRCAAEGTLPWSRASGGPRAVARGLRTRCGKPDRATRRRALLGWCRPAPQGPRRMARLGPGHPCQPAQPDRSIAPLHGCRRSPAAQSRVTLPRPRAARIGQGMACRPRLRSTVGRKFQRSGKPPGHPLQSHQLAADGANRRLLAQPRRLLHRCEKTQAALALPAQNQGP